MPTTSPVAEVASLFTIAPGASFVDALAQGLAARFGAAPEVLADITVLLPTRRACRALADAFLETSYATIALRCTRG